MKTVYTLLLCCLAMTLADRTHEEDNLITKHLNECRKELNIPVNQKSQSSGATTPQSEQNTQNTFGCLMFCMQKKRGLMNEDGSLNKQAIFASVLRDAPDRKESFEKLIDTCEKTVKPADGCKMAACLVPGVLSH